ncbi:MAG: hypothetical protein EPO24_04530, partial [Bacteroidetes bacterium]
MKPIITILVILGIIAALPLSAQQLVLKTYDRSSGLASNFVMNMYQDRDGFIWFATDRGVSRYDGNSFTTLTTRDGLPDNFVQYVTQDRDGFMWFGMYEHGAARFDGTRFQLFTSKEGLLGSTISWITQDHFGRLYFRTEEGLSLFHNGQFRAAVKTGRGEISTSHPDGRIYFAKGDTLFRIEPTNDNEIQYRKLCRIPYRGIISIGFFERESRAWDSARMYIGSYGGIGLVKFLNDTTVSPVAHYTVSRNVGTIIHEGDSVLWCGTLAEGIVKITPAGVTHFGTREGLLQQRVETLMRDYEGNLWLSTFGSGVQKLSAPSVVIYKKENGLAHNYVSKIFEDKSGKLWFGTSSGLSVRYHDTLIRLATHEPRVREIQSIIQDDDGNYFIGTFEYLFGPHSIRQLFSRDSLKPIRIGYGVSGIFPYRVPADSPRRLPPVWIGTFGNGINLLRADDSVIYSSGKEICSNVIEKVISTGGAAWFISRNGGASRLENGQFQLFSTANGLPSNAIFSVYEDSLRKKLWIGSDAGLTLLENGNIRTFTGQDGILGIPVLGIFPRAGHLRQTEDELFIVTQKALHRYSDNKIEISNTFSFAQEGSLSINDVLYSAQTDILWIGTIQGAYQIPLSSFHGATIAPKVAITSVLVDTTVLFTHATTLSGTFEPMELLHNQGNLTISYAGLSFVSESDVKFQIKLEPLDSYWSQPTNDNHLQVRNLPDGNYRFLVKAVSGEGVVSEEPALFSFRILPPFWKRWWFLSLTGLAFLGTVAGGIRYISQRQLRKQVQELERKQALQIERERISRDLHDNVGAQLVTIISGLELAGRYTDAKQRETKRMLDSLKDDARATMALLRETIWALQSAEMTVEKFTHELEQYVRKQLTYHPEIALRFAAEGVLTGTLRPVEAINVLRIVQEALSNCFKHASPTIIELHLTVESDNAIHLRMVNDGCKRERDSDLSGGKGLLNMERRAPKLAGAAFHIQESFSAGKIA